MPATNKIDEIIKKFNKKQILLSPLFNNNNNSKTNPFKHFKSNQSIFDRKNTNNSQASSPLLHPKTNTSSQSLLI